MITEESDLEKAKRLLKNGEYQEAFQAFNNVLIKNQHDYEAWTGLAEYMLMTCQLKEAKANFEFVTQQDPTNIKAWCGLAVTLNNMGDKLEACNAIDKAASIIPRNSSIQLLRTICYAELGASPKQICELFKCWGEMFADPITDQAEPIPTPEINRKNLTKKLKIGYVSADLRSHSVAFFMEPIFKHHDTQNFEIFVFSNTNQKDEYTERMMKNVKNWLEIYDKSDEEAYKIIRDLDIDILVDLSGHTLGNRLSLFAMRPAPVQVTWIGYMYPTGMKAIDYRLTSFALAPPGTEKYYNETLFRTTSGGVYTPPAGVKVATEPPCMRNGYPTLVSLNHSRKVTDAMLNVWHQILQLRPQAQLLILTKEISQEKAFENMLPRLEKLGMPLERIFISKQLPLSEFMALGNFVDIQLDTYPVSGGTTTLHALWMGLPVVALSGDDAMSNSTANILKLSHLDNWISVNENDYIAKVLELIDQQEKIKNFRKDIQNIMLKTSYMDYKGSTSELEIAYRLMWINHLTNEKKYLHSNFNPESIIEELAP